MTYSLLIKITEIILSRTHLKIFILLIYRNNAAKIALATTSEWPIKESLIVTMPIEHLGIFSLRSRRTNESNAETV